MIGGCTLLGVRPPRFGKESCMPYKAQHPCSERGCPNLCDIGQKYCEEHAKLHPSEFKVGRERGIKHEGGENASARGYGSRWQKARHAYLQKHPLCVECMKNGKYVRATVVDHIVPHKGDQSLFWDAKNWQSLCKSCHDRKTLSEEVRRDSSAPPVYDYPWRRNKT